MSANRCRARFGEALGGRGCRSVSSTVMALLAVVVLTAGAASSATTLPDGFVESKVASLSDITAMAFAPDGRLFVAQQGGQVRVIKNDVLLVVPFLTVTTDTSGERGLVGIAFDPGFAANGYLYVYYTATTPTTHNRVSRFTANGDVAVPESERVILELDTLGANIHNGGAMHFGADGKLYIATGENFTPSSAQTLESRFGKILRINADGTIPLDNPFYGTATGDNRAIWALGLRNPFSFAVQPGTGRIFINDVGESAWEEINEGAAGANYGWPMTEGFTSDPQFVGPIFSYPTRENGSCAGTGGTFYNPPVAQFPDEYVGTYFFLDFCGQWIGMFDPLQTVTLAGGELRAAPSAVTTFAEGLPLFNVHLVVGPDGSLFYASRDEGAVAGVYRIEYTGNLAPHIGTQPVSQIISVGRSGTFSVEATGAQPLGYQWQKSTNGGGRFNDVPGATSASYTTPAVTMLDQGIVFRCVVTNEFGKATSARATLTVTTNRPPTGTITSPAPGSLYSAGATIAYTGTATDPEDVPLPPTAFAWKVDFGHDTHFHPFVPWTSGATGGSFIIPRIGETATTVYYRIFLRITDSVGLTHMSFRDIRPRTSTITLATSPTGLLVTLDGQPKTAPHVFSSVVGHESNAGRDQPASTQRCDPSIPGLVGWGSGDTHHRDPGEQHHVHGALSCHGAVGHPHRHSELRPGLRRLRNDCRHTRVDELTDDDDRSAYRFSCWPSPGPHRIQRAGHDGQVGDQRDEILSSGCLARTPAHRGQHAGHCDGDDHVGRLSFRVHQRSAQSGAGVRRAGRHDTLVEHREHGDGRRPGGFTDGAAIRPDRPRQLSDAHGQMGGQWDRPLSPERLQRTAPDRGQHPGHGDGERDHGRVQGHRHDHGGAQSGTDVRRLRAGRHDTFVEYREHDDGRRPGGLADRAAVCPDRRR